MEEILRTLGLRFVKRTINFDDPGSYHFYFGNDSARDEIAYVSDMFEQAHDLGMVTVLWCYTRNSKFKVTGADRKKKSHRNNEKCMLHICGQISQR